MQSISRYIFKQLLTATVAITVGLTFAVWLTQSLRLIDYFVNRGVPAGTFLTFLTLLLPSLVGVVLPIATFCSVVFVYNKLTMDSELVVLRAAGLSQLQLAGPALILAVVMTAVVYSVSLYFLPASYAAFKDLQFELRSNYSAVLLQEGAFNSVSDGITVYVRERTSGGQLLGVLVHDTREAGSPVTMMAERGELVAADSGPRVVLVNGNRQQRDQKDGRVSVLYFDRYTVELKHLQETVHTRWREPKERFLGDLLDPNMHPSDKQYRSELIAEGHQRLVSPLYALAFVVIGLAALLSGEFNRRGQTRRILLAISCVARREAQLLALHDVTTRTLAAAPAMYAGPTLPILIALFVLFRKPRRAQPRGDLAGATAP